MKNDCDIFPTITDERDLGAFIGSDVDDYPLLDYEFRIYCHIVRRAGKFGRCFESHRKMAKHCRLTMRKFLNGIEFLVATGLVSRRLQPEQETFDYRLTSSKDWMPSGSVDACRAAITAKRKDKRKLSRSGGGVVRNRTGGSAEPDRRGTAPGSSAEPHGGGSAEPHGGGSAEPHDKGIPSKEITFKGIPLREPPLTPQGGNAIAPLGNSQGSEPSEPEQQETPPTVPVQGNKPGTEAETGSGAKCSAAAAARRKKEADHSPNEFQQIWEDYRQFVIEVQSTVAGNYTKWEAIAQWDALLKDGDTPADVAEGTAWYIQCKKIERQRKGEAIGIPHLHRYLRDRKWEAALEHKRSVGGVLPKVAVATPKTRGQQISENNSKILDAWLASDDAAQPEFITVEVKPYA